MYCCKVTTSLTYRVVESFSIKNSKFFFFQKIKKKYVTTCVINVEQKNVCLLKMVSKISKNQFQLTNEASFRVVLGILVRFKHMIRGIEQVWSVLHYFLQDT